VTLGNDNRTDGQTDGQTDRQTDRVRRNMRPPPREEGRIIITVEIIINDKQSIVFERWQHRYSCNVKSIIMGSAVS